MEIVVENLAHASDDVFYSTLGRLGAEHRSGSFILALCAALIGSALPHLRQAERLNAVLRRQQLGADALQEVISRAHDLSAPLRNAVAAFLPPSHRRRATPRTTETQVASVRLEVRPEPDAIASLARGQAASYATVLILSTPAHQDANKHLLLKNGFVPTVCATMDALMSDLAASPDICGCVVDRTFLDPLGATEQAEVFRHLASYSTLIAIRVDEGGLKLSSDEVEGVLRSERLHNRPVARRELSIQPGGSLRQTEIAAFARSATVLRSFETAAFVPGELNEDQRRLLIAAAYEHASELHLQGDIRVEALETRFLHGGYSGAKVARVRVNSDARAVVAKIGLKTQIREELERFRKFVQPVDDELKPFACFHGGSGAILFAFVPDEQDDVRPAKMLDERLQGFWSEEVMNRDMRLPYANLCRALDNAAGALRRLNTLKPVDTGMAAVGNPDVVASYLERLETAGVDLGFSPTLAESRRQAKIVFARLATAAVCHGDVHLRNILVRGDRSAHLIDFAGSGPGHPAVDLARLEVSLFTEFLRPIRAEDDYVRLQVRLSLDRASFEELVSEFQLDGGPSTNKLCVHGCVAARDNALRAVADHGGDVSDYLAAKYLIAWQSLLMHGRQAILTRSIIRALSGQFGNT